MKAEIEITADALYLYLDAMEIHSYEEAALRADGWALLNTGTILDDGRPALLFWKDIETTI